jgi:hypothetical protein
VVQISVKTPLLGRVHCSVIIDKKKNRDRNTFYMIGFSMVPQ